MQWWKQVGVSAGPLYTMLQLRRMELWRCFFNFLVCFLVDVCYCSSNRPALRASAHNSHFPSLLGSAWHYVFLNFVCVDEYLLLSFVITGPYLTYQRSMAWSDSFDCYRFCWDWRIVDLLKLSGFQWKIKMEVQGWLSAFHLRSEFILLMSRDALFHMISE